MAVEEYDESWDEFLDAYGKVKHERDQLRILICGFMEAIEDDEIKKAYVKAYEEITDGKSVSNS